MSKSKRAARGAVPAPQEMGNWLRTPKSGVRAGWLLAVSLLCYGLAALALPMGLSAGFAAVFRAWGVNSATAYRAPLWARMAYRWHGSLASLIVAAALLALTEWLRGLWIGRRDVALFEGKRFGLAALAGVGLALVVLLLGLIPDSLRPEWTAPRLRLSLIALGAVSGVSALAEEAFTKRALYDGLAGRWGRGWATGVVCALFFLANGGLSGSVPCALNVLLLGLLCCKVYDRHGLWAAAGLRWGWSFATAFLLGFGGGEVSVYRFFGVSEALLIGGDAGPMYGLWTTAVFAIALYGLYTRSFPLITRTSKGRSS